MMQEDTGGDGPNPFYIPWSTIMLVLSSAIVAGVLIYAFATAGSGAGPVC